MSLDVSVFSCVCTRKDGCCSSGCCVQERVRRVCAFVCCLLLLGQVWSTRLCVFVDLALHGEQDLCVKCDGMLLHICHVSCNDV